MSGEFMTLDFIVTTQLEMFLKDYISHHTHSGKYHGSKQIRQMYYKLKQHNLKSLERQVYSPQSRLMEKGLRGDQLCPARKQAYNPVDALYSKRAKRTKDLWGTF